MVKKLVALLLCFLLIVPSVAFAKAPDISRLTESEKLELLNNLLDDVSDEDLTAALRDRIIYYSDDAFSALYNIMIVEAEERGIKAYQTLQNGSRGEDVQALQQRLIDLNYLSGSADGAFGNKTVEAIKAFQYEADLPQTGIADPITQIYLFTDDAPSAPKQEAAKSTTPPQTQTSNSSNSIRPSVKEALDSYEEFFDEYCEFMEKYSKSNYPITMLMDYMSFLDKYSDAMDKLDKMESDLNTAELAYYTQVMARITQKLAKISY